MLCRNPVVLGIEPFRCGQCMPCRLNRRRIWSHRLMLEALLHGSSVFVTLTYSDVHLPADGSLQPKDVQLFLKRLRLKLKMEYDITVRYFCVGEYGDESFRPHYHMALFGYPVCERGRTDQRLMNWRRRGSAASGCCQWCNLLEDCWQLGGVDIGELNAKSAQYVVGYVTKKMTKEDDPRLNGRAPEFARMSLKPGLGAGAVSAIALALNDDEGGKLLQRDGDVPVVVQHGGRKFPLGRYLRRLLREEIGIEVSAEVAEARYEELLAMRKAAGSNAAYRKLKPFVDHAGVDRVEYRAGVYKRRGSL